MFDINKTLKDMAVNFSRHDKSLSETHKNDLHSDLINTINQTIFEIDDNYQWIYLNPEWEKLTGYSVAETLGTSILNYIHPDEKEQAIVFLNDIYINKPHSSSIRTRLLATDNHVRWTHIRANCFVKDESKTLHLTGIISDISVRVHEYGLHLANYRTLSTLINNLCGLVYRGRNDHDWTMEYVSDGCFDLTGYPASELVNKTVTFGSLINPNDQDLVWTNVQTALREHRPYELNYRIKTKDGTEKWVWERGIGNFSTNGELLSIEGFIVDITDYKKNKLNQIEELLYRTKTKLPQKHLFLDRLNIAIERSKSVDGYEFALFIIHIDRFKRLQDVFSADIIDKIIMNISEQISDIITEVDSLCLFGEGEFALLLEHTTNINTVRKVIQKIREVLQKPIKIKTTETYISASIGIYSSEGTINDRKMVIKNAYAAMYKAKSLGGSRYEIFDEIINNRLYALDRMDKEILLALKNHELTLCYQPVLSVDNSINKCIETRLYWMHPRRGKIPSELFTAVESNTQVITQINKWLLSSFFQQLIIWDSDPAFSSSLDVNIRFFGENIYTFGLLTEIEQQMKNIALKNEIRISIILNESDIRSLTRDCINTLNRLHKNKLGLILSIGKSSLPLEESSLQLPIHMVRLDCPQLKKNSAALQSTNAKINYIKALGKKVIVSGIDTKEKLGLIKLIKCDYIQGDSVSPAIDAEDIFKTLSQVYAPT